MNGMTEGRPTRQITEPEAIAIATDHARSQGISTEGCLFCGLVEDTGKYLVGLRMPAADIELEKQKLDDDEWVHAPAPTPGLALAVKVDSETGAADTFHPL